MIEKGLMELCKASQNGILLKQMDKAVRDDEVREVLNSYSLTKNTAYNALKNTSELKKELNKITNQALSRLNEIYKVKNG